LINGPIFPFSDAMVWGKFFLRCFLWSLKRPLSRSGIFTCQRLRAALDYCPDRRENEKPNECVGGLEKFWWENGTPKLFSPNLITLAEKLGFNVERFPKITSPSIPISQS